MYNYKFRTLTKLTTADKHQVGVSGLKLRANVTSKAKAKALQKLQQDLDMVGDEDEDEVQALPAAPVDDPEEQITQFAIRTETVEDVRNECRRLNYPLLEEYDFRHDHVREGAVRVIRTHSSRTSSSPLPHALAPAPPPHLDSPPNSTSQSATSPKLDIRLRPTTSVRPHQEKALQNLFGVARVRSKSDV